MTVKRTVSRVRDSQGGLKLVAKKCQRSFLKICLLDTIRVSFVLVIRDMFVWFFFLQI
jgi:hypothetical protein